MQTYCLFGTCGPKKAAELEIWKLDVGSGHFFTSTGIRYEKCWYVGSLQYKRAFIALCGDPSFKIRFSHFMTWLMSGNGRDIWCTQLLGITAYHSLLPLFYSTIRKDRNEGETPSGEICKKSWNIWKLWGRIAQV